MRLAPLKLDLTESDLEQIKAVVDAIKSDDTTGMRSDAMNTWMNDFYDQGDKVARAWVLATISYLTVKGFEIKKK